MTGETWIDVRCALPELTDRDMSPVVTVLCEGEDTPQLARYTRSGWSLPYVTHWLALPPHPRGDRK